MNLLNLLGVCMILVLTLYLATPALAYIIHFRAIRDKDKKLPDHLTITSTYEDKEQ